jgi:hypothetical protein
MLLVIVVIFKTTPCVIVVIILILMVRSIHLACEGGERVRVRVKGRVRVWVSLIIKENKDLI